MSPDISITDQELLLLIKGNDYVAFDKLYRRHWPSVYDVAYKRLKDRDMSKDIVQDIFVDLWDKRKSKQIMDLVPYLHTAVRYKIYTLLAKNKATPHFVEPFEAMARSPFEADAHFGKEELEEVLNTWLQTLPPKRAEIFRLRFMEDISTKEISTRLNIPQKTVQNQLNLARHELKDYLSYFLIFLTIVKSL